MNFITQKKFFLLILLAWNGMLIAQAFQKKDISVSFGVGLTHLKKSEIRFQTQQQAFKDGFNGEVETSVKGTNPMTLKYEYAITKNFSLGASLSWYNIEILVKDSYVANVGISVNRPYEDNYSYKLRSGSLGIRPNYHWPVKKIKSDFFVGCAFGITLNSLEINLARTSGSTELGFADIKLPKGLYIAPTFGYRYYFTENFCFNAEAGYEKGALLLIGLAYRFRPFRYEYPKN